MPLPVSIDLSPCVLLLVEYDLYPFDMSPPLWERWTRHDVLSPLVVSLAFPELSIFGGFGRTGISGFCLAVPSTMEWSPFLVGGEKPRVLRGVIPAFSFTAEVRNRSS